MEKYEFIEYTADAVVVGAGHAGCEAALALARTGLDTVMLTLNLDSIGFMPCNPSIGDTAKGHLVREMPTRPPCNFGCSTSARARRCKAFGPNRTKTPITAK